MNLQDALKKFYEFHSKVSAYGHAMSLIYYDGATVAPSGTAANRSHALTVLSEQMYTMSTDKEIVDLLTYLDKNSDKLNERDARAVYLSYKNIKEMRHIPMEEYVAFEQLLVEADDVWHRAKAASDFAMFCPVLEKIFETTARFARYCAPDMDPYDYCLNKYEDGLDRATCDAFFAKLKETLLPLIRRIRAKAPISVECLKGQFDDQQQQAFALTLMRTMGIDLDHCGLGTTEHPFTTSIGSHHDVRITTNYDPTDLSYSMYSVIHEGGHALYDMHSDDAYAYTPLDGGVSMGIHESQSRFYENLLGRSEPFIRYIFPEMQHRFPEPLSHYTAEDVYRAVNRVTPSLIRTESDEVTYCLHVMIRYELERRVIGGELAVRDLPAEWARLYKEYLGVDVPDDKHGVLQDSHWSGGSIGYFPSYALGSAYGAQLLARMKEEVDVDACLSRGDFAPINAWNREHIWRHGSLKAPNVLLREALGCDFDPTYYTDYLTEKYTKLYDL